MKDDHNDYQKSAKRYMVNIPNFNWDKVMSFLNNHQNVNNVGTSIVSGIISTFIMVAFQVIFFA